MTRIHDSASVSEWWAANPQTYAAEHGTSRFADNPEAGSVEFGSEQFFRMADAELYSWNTPLHVPGAPFGQIFPYEKYSGRAVLEIGCGMGCMAMNWAERGARVTAVDLNPVAVAQTRRRFELRGLPGVIQQEDARRLSFADASFDYGYSWGVLHHSPDLAYSFAELFRVLKPGAEFGVMLYNRRSLLYWYHIVYLEGFLHAERKFLTSLELASRYTDGDRQEGNPHTWPVTSDELSTMLKPHADNVRIRVLGTDIDPMLRNEIMPGLARFVPRQVLKSVGRRWGWSLWVSGTKKP